MIVFTAKQLYITCMGHKCIDLSVFRLKMKLNKKMPTSNLVFKWLLYDENNTGHRTEP